MHPDTSLPTDLPSGWATGLTPDETAALLRQLHDLAHDEHPEETDLDLRF